MGTPKRYLFEETAHLERSTLISLCVCLLSIARPKAERPETCERRWIDLLAACFRYDERVSAGDVLEKLSALGRGGLGQTGNCSEVTADCLSRPEQLL